MRDFLDEKVRESLLYQSEDGGYRVWGGFVCITPNLIRFEKIEEAENENGEWEEHGGLSSPFDLLQAKMVQVELEEIVRHASYPWNKEWRLVQLRWEPTIRVAETTVGVKGARLLLSQLNQAILDAEMIEGYQAEARGSQ